MSSTPISTTANVSITSCRVDMVVQLLDEVVGIAVAVLFYAILCLTASCIMIWLVWTHHERDSCKLQVTEAIKSAILIDTDIL